MQDRWKTLLQPKRFRKRAQERSFYDERNEFENDYTRIILSPHFRRLQDKTQVFPYDDTDFVRTRLTHSLEVSSFARSLGLSLEKRLIEKNILPQEHYGYIPSILATAGLIHDIGNPPFGHFGEDCIKSFFASSKLESFNNLSEDEKNDFKKFDGNAQTFRVLRKLGPSFDEYSYNLTFPVLSCIIKYPYSSTLGNNKSGNRISQKKFGYFQSEKDDFKNISEELTLGTQRHPLVFLLEAADDVAFSVSDIEDGCKKGIITRDKLYSQIEDIKNKEFVETQKKILGEIEKQIPKDHPSHFILVIQRYRIQSHSEMLQAASQCFIENHDDILSGKFDKDLMDSSRAALLRKLFKNLSVINFNHESVLKREIAGHAALNFLLNVFSEALIQERGVDDNSKAGKLSKLVSRNYWYIINKYEKSLSKEYAKYLLLTDFISGMTDTYALKIYHELSGISPY